DKEFTIRGIEDCLARGFDRAGFFEVDTGEQRAWTVQLTESTEQTPQRTMPQYAPINPPPPAAGQPGTPFTAPNSSRPPARGDACAGPSSWQRSAPPRPKRS